MALSPFRAPLVGALFFFSAGFACSVQAASCCGGGGATSLVLPKYSQTMVGLTLEAERYDGAWHQDGTWVADPAGSSLNQYRASFGYAHRLGANWQGSVSLPWVVNRNRYAGFSRDSDGLGDTTLSLLWESFDNITCVYRVKDWKDLIPAIYLGSSLTLPTGVSPYDNVSDNFDITGRGFYRLDGTLLVEKTVYPWNVGLQLTYGTHPARPVNREYGRYVAPYTKRLGDRASGSISLGYTWFTRELNTWTATLATAELWEDKATVGGAVDPTTGLRKRSLTGTVAWTTADRGLVVKLSWNHSPRQDGWGENFPSTDVISIGINRVLSWRGAQ